MNPQYEHPRSHDLCAWLLGELPPDEAAAVERALTDDPALRAERARLEATIGTVRDAFPEDDALSNATRAALLAEAEQQVASRRGRPRILATSALVAAAAVLLALTWRLTTVTPADTGLEVVRAERFDREISTTSEEPEVSPTPKRVMVDDSSRLQDAAASESTLLTFEQQLVAAASELRDEWASEAAAGFRLTHVYRAVDAKPDWDRIAALKIDAETPAIHTIVPSTPGPTGPATPEIDRRKEEFRRWAEPIDETRVAYGTVLEPEATAVLDSLVVAVPNPVLGTPLDVVAGGTIFLDADQDVTIHLTPTADDILAHCRRRPTERPAMMYFRYWGDNGFELAALDRLSTFAVDVDTASYALARRYLNEGLVPEKAQIRTEEFLNAFAPDLAPPTEGTFRVALELADSMFGGDDPKWLLRVTLRGKEVAREARQPLRLTFVVDTSGSMKQENRIELVKHALRLLVHQLDERDALAIVTFADAARLHLPMTNAADKATIEGAIHALAANGSTNAEAGLMLGYAHTAEQKDPEASHRVVLLSDGVANVGQTDHDRLTAAAAGYKAQGIGLNTVGVGLGNHNDVLLEQLADQGDGLCSYVDSPEEAKRALVDRFVGAFEPIARDVKVQVDFDPRVVKRYRLLGYENRAVADADFRNDAVDAGEVGAGHQVTALYELEPIDPTGGDVGDAVLATAHIRWLPPHGRGDEAQEMERAIAAADRADSFATTTAGYRRATLVAQFAELLRRSTHARGDSLDLLLHEAIALDTELGDPQFSEFRALVEKSRGLIVEQLPASDPLTQAIDAVRKNAILKAELEELARGEDQALLEALERENARLEEKLRELLERRLKDDG